MSHDMVARAREHIEFARLLESAGDDARPLLDEALRELDTVTDDPRALIARIDALCLRGDAEFALGGEPAPWYERALVDADAAARGECAARARIARASVLVRLAGLDGRTARPLVARAVRDVKAVLRDGPGHIFVMHLIMDDNAAEDSWLRRHLDCVPLLEALRVLAPESAGVLALLGDACHACATGRLLRRIDPWPDLSRGRSAYDAALRLSPGSARIHWRRARLVADMARYKARQGRPFRELLDEAVRSCDRAIRFGLAQAYEDRAGLHVVRAHLGEPGALDAAIADYAEAISRSPSAALHCDRGRAYAQRGSFDEALADFASAAALDPLLDEAPFMSGCVELALAHCDRAITHFDEALRIRPRCAVSARQKAVARLLRGDDVDFADPVLTVLALAARLDRVRRAGGDVPPAATALVRAWRIVCRRRLDTGCLNALVARALLDASRFRDAEKALVRAGCEPLTERGTLSERIARELRERTGVREWIRPEWPSP